LTQDNTYQILSESFVFCRRVGKTLWCVFSVHSVVIITSSLLRVFALMIRQFYSISATLLRFRDAYLFVSWAINNLKMW